AHRAGEQRLRDEVRAVERAHYLEVEAAVLGVGECRGSTPRAARQTGPVALYVEGAAQRAACDAERHCVLHAQRHLYVDRYRARPQYRATDSTGGAGALARYVDAQVAGQRQAGEGEVPVAG